MLTNERNRLRKGQARAANKTREGHLRGVLACFHLCGSLREAEASQLLKNVF